MAGQRRSALTQTMDLMPTFLDLFGLPVPPEVRARSVVPLLERDATQRDVGIFGMFGGPIGATDGRYTYYLYPGRPLCAGPARIHADADAPALAVQRRRDEDDGARRRRSTSPRACRSCASTR